MEVIGDNKIAIIFDVLLKLKKGLLFNIIDFFFQESVHDEKGNEVHEQTRERYLERIAD